MHSLGLTWVLVAGRPSHVSRFAGLTPRHRPVATCPECGRRLTLKLGRVRRHHAAHAPRDRCVATRPETALHLDLKFHLAAHLEAAIGLGQPLVVRRQCAGTQAESCDMTHEHAWMTDWDEVIVEARLPSADGCRRPDIVLCRQRRAIGAIEVLVSHAVGDEKAAALAAAGVPWVEIRADAAELLDGDAAWSVDRPLPVERAARGTAPAPQADDSSGSWRCPRHEQAHRVWTAETAARRAAEAEAERRVSVLRGARVVDIYHAGGARDRVIYRVDEQLLDGHVYALALRRGGLEVASQPARDSAESKRSAWAALCSAYAADVERLAARPGAFADSPMRWATSDAAENIVGEALLDLVPGDPTPLATRYPRRWFYARERGEWFLPRDMRRVRWDRAEPDVFAAHPAWAAGRAAVRERPAPGDAWTTFVFASRPSVASFGASLRVEQQGVIAVIHVDVVHPLARRALVVLAAAAADEEVRDVARKLDMAGVEQLWLSHPLDWSASRADLAWAAAGRDSRGRGAVVVDGLGVYRADQFIKAFSRGDRRLTPDAIRAKMADRVALLGGAVAQERVL